LNIGGFNIGKLNIGCSVLDLDVNIGVSELGNKNVSIGSKAPVGIGNYTGNTAPVYIGTTINTNKIGGININNTSITAGTDAIAGVFEDNLSGRINIGTALTSAGTLTLGNSTNTNKIGGIQIVDKSMTAGSNATINLFQDNISGIINIATNQIFNGQGNSKVTIGSQFTSTRIGYIIYGDGKFDWFQSPNNSFDIGKSSNISGKITIGNNDNYTGDLIIGSKLNTNTIGGITILNASMNAGTIISTNISNSGNFSTVNGYIQNLNISNIAFTGSNPFTLGSFKATGTTISAGSEATVGLLTDNGAGVINLGTSQVNGGILNIGSINNINTIGGVSISNGNIDTPSGTIAATQINATQLTLNIPPLMRYSELPIEISTYDMMVGYMPIVTLSSSKSIFDTIPSTNGLKYYTFSTTTAGSQSLGYIALKPGIWLLTAYIGSAIGAIKGTIDNAKLSFHDVSGTDNPQYFVTGSATTTVAFSSLTHTYIDSVSSEKTIHANFNPTSGGVNKAWTWKFTAVRIT
jgi:hypothetical protein